MDDKSYDRLIIEENDYARIIRSQKGNKRQQATLERSNLYMYVFIYVWMYTCMYLCMYIYLCSYEIALN